MKEIDRNKIIWINDLKDFKEIDFDKKGLEFYFLSWTNGSYAYLQLEKLENNTSDKIINKFHDGYLRDVDYYGEEEFDETNEIYKDDILINLFLSRINDESFIKKFKNKFIEYEKENYKNGEFMVKKGDWGDWRDFFEWMGVHWNVDSWEWNLCDVLKLDDPNNIKDITSSYNLPRNFKYCRFYSS